MCCRRRRRLWLLPKEEKKNVWQFNHIAVLGIIIVFLLSLLHVLIIAQLSLWTQCHGKLACGFGLHIQVVNYLGSEQAFKKKKQKHCIRNPDALEIRLIERLNQLIDIEMPNLNFKFLPPIYSMLLYILPPFTKRSLRYAIVFFASFFVYSEREFRKKKKKYCTIYNDTASWECTQLICYLWSD